MSVPLTQARILVIDDFQGMRTMLRDFVRAMGVSQVDTAASGKEALNQLRGNRYDIVICDYHLGLGPNGQQILDEARMNDLIGVSTIWMIVTAEKTTDMVMSAAEVKPDDYLLKPISQNLLKSRLEKLILRKQSLRSIDEAIKARNHIAAIAQCDQLIKAQAVNPQGILRIKSELLLTVGDYEAAKALFESILVTRNVPWAKTGLGKVCYHLGDFSQARDIFQQVISDNQMFMEASDWLVKSLQALGESGQAQQALQDAVKLSPNCATRQRILGDTAYHNGALDVAQAAFETSIRISEFSPHKSASMYTGLAKVLSDKNAPDKALKVLTRSRNAFKNDTEAAIQTAAVESAVYTKMGQTDKAQASMADAEHMLRSLPGKVSSAVAMEMAHGLLALGKKDQACELMRDLVKNNHENAMLTHQIEAVFQHAKLGVEGLSLVRESQQEVISINNQGVILAKKGEFLEGVKLLRTAVQNLPNNEVVIMNLCGLLIGLMDTQGKDDALVHEVKGLLWRVRELNPANKKYLLYMDALNRAGGDK
jgi:DNA-binding response OmpR family regulator/Tfp pilus assembly protein PilF